MNCLRVVNAAWNCAWTCGELEQRLVLCYTGKPRQSGINNWEVFKAHIDGKRKVQANLERISEVAQAMRDSLEQTDWKETGRLMREEWTFRKKSFADDFDQDHRPHHRRRTKEGRPCPAKCAEQAEAAAWSC